MDNCNPQVAHTQLRNSSKQTLQCLEWAVIPDFCWGIHYLPWPMSDLGVICSCWTQSTINLHWTSSDSLFLIHFILSKKLGHGFKQLFISSCMRYLPFFLTFLFFLPCFLSLGTVGVRSRELWILKKCCTSKLKSCFLWENINDYECWLDVF